MSEYYFVYKTTNLLDGMFYVGCHKTKKLDDGYLGSGLRLTRSIKKYGEENFKKEILSYHGSLKEMFEAEAKIVTADFVARKDTYNLTEGGKTPGLAILKSAGKKGGAVNKKNGTGIFSAKCRENIVKWQRSEDGQKHMKAMQSKGLNKINFDSDILSKRADTLRSIDHQKGSKNSQFGTITITDGKFNKRIKKTDLIPEGWRKGMTFSEEAKKKCAVKSKGKMWITNGAESTMIIGSDPIPTGWKRGRTVKKK